MMLTEGYHDVPAGKIAVVVTHLEMRSKPALRPVAGATENLAIRPIAMPALDWYRDLFRRVGGDWLWFSRLKLSDAELAAIIRNPSVDLFALSDGTHDVGLLELDFRQPNECELAFFGVTREQIGTGAARLLMNEAITRAWARPDKPIGRFWVHTCTGDHPAAVQFYIRSGFRPFKRQIEIADDPRISSGHAATAAPHVPIIRP